MENNLSATDNSRMQLFRQGMTRDDFLRLAYSKSKSISSQNTAKYVLVSLDKFCNSKYGKDLDLLLDELKSKQGDEKYYFMQDYVHYLDELGRSPKTIHDYFSWAKLYLRRAKGIKLYEEDVRDLIVTPKVPQIQRKPLTPEIIKPILDNSKERQKALFLTLLSSGMRLREALALHKRDFDFENNPVKITIPAQYTKAREQRETYISSEATEILLRIVKNVDQNDLVFTDQNDLQLAVFGEERTFDRIRKRCGFEEKYAQTNRFTVNIHSFRAYFITKATQTIDPSFAHALAGHHEYLPQYYRLTPQERGRLYLRLEPALLIYTSNYEINSLQQQVEDLQNKIRMLGQKFLTEENATIH